MQPRKTTLSGSTTVVHHQKESKIKFSQNLNRVISLFNILLLLFAHF